MTDVAIVWLFCVFDRVSIVIAALCCYVAAATVAISVKALVSNTGD